MVAVDPSAVGPLGSGLDPKGIGAVHKVIDPMGVDAAPQVVDPKGTENCVYPLAQPLQSAAFSNSRRSEKPFSSDDVADHVPQMHEVNLQHGATAGRPLYIQGLPPPPRPPTQEEIFSSYKYRLRAKHLFLMELEALPD